MFLQLWVMKFFAGLHDINLNHKRLFAPSYCDDSSFELGVFKINILLKCRSY